MSDNWYNHVNANSPLTQGDVILDCPLIGWANNDVVLKGEGESETLKSATTAIQADVVVMTQACDLEHRKITNLILCPHSPIEDFRKVWDDEMKRSNQNPTSKAWKAFCEDVRDGYVWNLAMLNAGESGSLKIEHRIVDFRDIYTIPVTFLESLLRQRAVPRLSLNPPYREHLSQAFARFFMRVGLPSPVTSVW